MRNTCYSLLLFFSSFCVAAGFSRPTEVGRYTPRPESPIVYDVQIASAGVACTQGINRAQAVTQAPTGTKFQWTITNGTIAGAENAPTVEFVTSDDESVGYAVLTLTMTQPGGTPLRRPQALPIFNPPVITRQPRGVTIAAGGSTTLTIEATNDAFVYDWFEGALGDTSKPVAAG